MCIREKMSIKIMIKLNSNHKGTLKCPGMGEIKCVGNYNEHYPKNEFTIHPQDRNTMFPQYRSRTYESGVEGVGCLMEYSIKLDGTHGIFIHAWINLEGQSHGCIHLLRNDAKKLFNIIKNHKRVRVQIYK